MAARAAAARLAAAADAGGAAAAGRRPARQQPAAACRSGAAASALLMVPSRWHLGSLRRGTPYPPAGVARRAAALSVVRAAVVPTPARRPEPPPPPAQLSYSSLAYWSPALGPYAVDSLNQRSVIAKDEIAPGQLLALEHMMALPWAEAALVVINNAELFDMLAPREPPFDGRWAELMAAGDWPMLKRAAAEKLASNAFQQEEGTVVLPRCLSALNHACAPVAHVARAGRRKVLIDGVPHAIHFSALYAVSAARPGEEVTIAYHPSAGHEGNQATAWGFACGCDRSLPAREAGAGARASQVDGWMAQDATRLQELLTAYASSPEGIYTTALQVLARRGLFYGDADTYVKTCRFEAAHAGVLVEDLLAHVAAQCGL